MGGEASRDELTVMRAVGAAAEAEATQDAQRSLAAHGAACLQLTDIARTHAQSPPHHHTHTGSPVVPSELFTH